MGERTRKRSSRFELMAFGNNVGVLELTEYISWLGRFIGHVWRSAQHQERDIM